jgi:hypothetical protein
MAARRRAQVWEGGESARHLSEAAVGERPERVEEGLRRARHRPRGVVAHHTHLFDLCASGGPYPLKPGGSWSTVRESGRGKRLSWCGARGVSPQKWRGVRDACAPPQVDQRDEGDEGDGAIKVMGRKRWQRRSVCLKGCESGPTREHKAPPEKSTIATNAEHHVPKTLSQRKRLRDPPLKKKHVECVSDQPLHVFATWLRDSQSMFALPM